MKPSHPKIQSHLKPPLPSTPIFITISKRKTPSHVILNQPSISTIYQSIDKICDEINTELRQSVKFQTLLWRKFNTLLQQHWQYMIELLEQQDQINQPDDNVQSTFNFDLRIMKGFEVLANQIVRHRLQSLHNLQNLTEKQIKLSMTPQRLIVRAKKHGRIK